VVKAMTGAATLAGSMLVLVVAGCAGVQPTAADATQPTPVERPAPPQAEEAAGGVDPARFTPYFASVPGGPQAAEALAAGDSRGARAAMLAIAAAEGTPDVVVVRARFVAAVCAHEAGDHAAALAELPGLAAELPLLADHARYLAAVSAYRVDDFERADALAQEVSAASPLRPDAELLRGDALRALGRFAEAEPVYRAYVHQRRGAPRLAEATYKLAEAVERTFGVEVELDRVRDAVRWYRRVTYRYPRSSWADQARDRIAAVAARLPADERAAASALSADEQLELAQAYAQANRHQQAIAEFTKVLALTDPDGSIGCQARLGIGRAASDGRQRAVAIEALTQAAERCDEPDVRAWALYLAGRARTATGDDRGAIEAFARLEDDYPEHRLADDARLRRALAAFRLGRSEEFATLLSEFATRYPEGDMRCEAQWQLAWAAYRAGRNEEALRGLEVASQACTAAEEGAGGRERYWAARTLERLGRTDDAAREYEAVATQHPLSYYMLLATERLEAIAPRSIERVLARLGAGRPASANAGAWRFDPGVLQRQPGFVRGIELHRLGLSSRARLEFAAADAGLPAGEDARWLSALLYHEVGSYAASHWIARRQLTAWQGAPPAEGNRRFWLIAYPRGFADLVEREAGNEHVDAELLWAVMREESGFTPGVESYANAVGLLQLLPGTARRFARGLACDRDGLKQPENNVPIAARYLSFLLARNHGRELLAVASYNAGEGAVDRWRSAEPSLELDEALEEFSYDQTRRYTRRVLSSYGTYHFLFGGRLPRLLGDGVIEPTRSAPAPGAARAASAPSG
jgi:soluble lytic murein transglycosylase